MITGRRIRPLRRSVLKTWRAMSRDTTSVEVTQTNTRPTHSRDNWSYCARNSTATRNPVATSPATINRRSSSPNRLTARARNRLFAPIISTQTGTMNTANSNSSRSVASGTGLTSCWVAVATAYPTTIAATSEAINMRRRRCGLGCAGGGSPTGAESASGSNSCSSPPSARRDRAADSSAGARSGICCRTRSLMPALHFPRRSLRPQH